MKRLMKLAGLGVAAAVLFYGAVWYMAARQALDTATQVVASAEQSGWVVRSAEEPSVGGFPGRLVVTMGEVTARRVHERGEVTTVTLTPEAAMLPWRPTRLDIAYTGISYRIDDAEGAPLLQAVAESGHAVLEQPADRVGQRAEASIRDLRLTDRTGGGDGLSPGLTLESARIVGLLAPDPAGGPESIAIEVDLDALRAQRADLQELFGGRRGDLHLSLTGHGVLELIRATQQLRLKDRPPTREEVLAVLTGWRDGRGRLVLDRLALTVTPTTVTATLDGSLDDAGEWDASGVMEIEGVIQFLAEPAATTLLGPNEVLTAQLIVAGLTETLDGGRHGVRLDLAVADGEARIGPIIRQAVPSAADLADHIAQRVARDWDNFRLVPVKN
ncbi:MAG: DUF2125 domain-containing protein [Alphaproteobacteria bacterium]|nr:DUF2125 domain-containing protein [Alphaproteobacteria bacterium]